uniref:RRM domain-containing protein n=1 Tax=Mustela putorius furo TaxID=9669 RepID=M3YYU6_MUSPF
MTSPHPSNGVPSSSRGSNGKGQLSKTSIYIRGLQPGTTDQDPIKSYWSYSRIVSPEVILEKSTSKCSSCGFVDFDPPSAAQKTVTALKASGIQAQSHKATGAGPHEHLSIVPLAMDKQELEGKPSGQVILTRILRDTSGSRGDGFARMESAEKCEIITHFNGKCIKTPAGVPAPSDPLLCRFADGPQKWQNQGKSVQNGQAWLRNAAMGGIVLTGPQPSSSESVSRYNISCSRMLAQSAPSPCLPSPVSSDHMGATHLQFCPEGMDHPISLQPAFTVGPHTHQGYLSLSSTGMYMPMAVTTQGAHISQYTPVPS